jgi:hypothetical protein
MHQAALSHVVAEGRQHRYQEHRRNELVVDEEEVGIASSGLQRNDVGFCLLNGLSIRQSFRIRCFD